MSESIGFVPYPDVLNHYSDEIELNSQLDKEVWVTPKLDGTNFTAWWDPEGKRVRFGSHRREIDPLRGEDNQGAVVSVLRDEMALDLLKFATRQYGRVYGEYLVRHTVSTYLPAAWHKHYIFHLGDVRANVLFNFWEEEPDCFSREAALFRWFRMIPAERMTVWKALETYGPGGGVARGDVASFLLDESLDPKLESYEGVVLHGDLRDVSGNRRCVKIVNPRYRESKRSAARDTSQKIMFSSSPFESHVPELLTDERIEHRMAALGGRDAFSSYEEAYYTLAQSLLEDMVKEDLVPSLKPIMDLQRELSARVKEGEKGVQVPQLPDVHFKTCYRLTKRRVYDWMKEHCRFEEAV